MADKSTGGSESTATPGHSSLNVVSWEHGRLRQSLPAVVSRCMAYSAMTCFDDALVAAVFRFYGLEVDVATAEAEILEDEAERVRFFPWFLWDWRAHEHAATVGELFRDAGDLTPHERRVVDALCRSHVGFYEVQTRDDLGVTLSDLAAGGIHDVRDEALAADVQVGQILQARLVRVPTTGGERVLIDAIYAALPSEARAAVQLEIESLVGEHAKPQPQLEALAPEMLDFADHLLDSLAQPPTTHNSDGDDLILCTAVLSERESDAVMRALRGPGIAGFERLAGDQTLWRADAGAVGLIDASDPARVKLLANSPVRHQTLTDRVVAACEIRAARLVSLEDFGRSVQRWAERGGGCVWLRADPDVPSAVRAWFAAWARQWLDMPLAALGDRTPREAVRSNSGREAVTRMVARFEDLLLGELGAVSCLSLQSLRAELGMGDAD